MQTVSINNNKYNLNLEALRGFAAILVLLTHLTGPEFFFKTNTGYYFRLLSAWGTEAVIIFFVLSGIVIHASFNKVPRTNAGFLANRIIRLHPILVLTVGVVVLIEKFIFHHSIDGWQVVGNIIPVSSFNSALAHLYMDSNPVIWSLSFEMFFYVVFAVGGIYKSKINHNFLGTWFILSIAGLAGYYCISSSVPIVNYLLLMLSFSCIWLVGFFIWYIQGIYRSNIFSAVFSLGCLPLISRLHLMDNYYDPIKYMLFAVASVPFFIYLCQLGQSNVKAHKKGTIWLVITIICFLFSAVMLSRDDSYKNIMKGVYILLPFLAVLFYIKGFRAIARFIYYRIILHPFSYIGKISYSIYLIHFPILVVICSFAMPLILKFVLSIAAVFFISWFLETRFQPFIKGVFRRAAH